MMAPPRKGQPDEGNTASAGSGGAADLSDRRRVLLFDLDGTLVDTSRDIAAGVAGLFRERGLPAPGLEMVLRHVGYGIQNLVVRCLEEAGRSVEGAEDADEAVRQFRRSYARHLLDTTRPYPGLEATLRSLHLQGRRMGVVSNKTEDFTRQILEGLDLGNCFAVILGGDSLPTRKPDPAPLLHALKICKPGAQPAEAVYFGDSMVDVEAANAAGIPFCGVAWGFNPGRRLNRSLCRWWFSEPEQLSAYLLADH